VVVGGSVRFESSGEIAGQRISAGLRRSPSFTLPTAGGGSTSLADYRGKTVLLYFHKGLGFQPCWASSATSRTPTRRTPRGVGNLLAITTGAANLLAQKLRDDPWSSSSSEVTVMGRRSEGDDGEMNMVATGVSDAPPDRGGSQGVAGVGRRCAAVAVVVLTLGLWSVVSAPIALAHATLLASTPPSGYAVATAPTEITLDFDEAVSIDVTPVTLSDTAGHPVALGPEALTLQGRRLSAPITGPMPLGGYRAQWQVTADDGDLITGVVTFTVGAGPAPGAVAGGGSTLDTPVVTVGRWVLFAALALALGGAVGDLLARQGTCSPGASRGRSVQGALIWAVPHHCS